MGGIYQGLTGIPRSARNNLEKKSAFTLAEVLTTLLVIGIISAITLPILNSNVDDKISASQKQTFKTKFNETLRYMQIKGALAERYSSTEDFVSMMQKYANISKVCDSMHLTGCFSASINESRKVVKYQTKNLRTSDNIEAAFTENTNINGIVFGDGSNALIAYEKNCLITNKFDPTANLTECFAMIYDVNGKEGPNILGEDINTYNLSYGDTDGEYTLLPQHALTKAECEKARDEEGAPIITCESNTDYWAYYVRECHRKGKRLPSQLQLKQLAEKIYGEETISLTAVDNNLEVQDTALWNKVGGKGISGNAKFTIFSRDEYPNSGIYVWQRQFLDTSTGAYYWQSGNRTSKHYGYCVDN